MSERQYPPDINRVSAIRTPLFDFRPSRFPLHSFSFFSFPFLSLCALRMDTYNAPNNAALTNKKPKKILSQEVNFSAIGRRSEGGRSSTRGYLCLMISFNFPLIFHFPLQTIHHTSSNLSLPLLSRASNRMSDG